MLEVLVGQSGPSSSPRGFAAISFFQGSFWSLKGIIEILKDESEAGGSGALLVLLFLCSVLAVASTRQERQRKSAANRLFPFVFA